MAEFLVIATPASADVASTCNFLSTDPPIALEVAVPIEICPPESILNFSVPAVSTENVSAAGILLQYLYLQYEQSCQVLLSLH